MSKSDSPTLAQIAQKILEDALQNIIHDVVIHRHYEHKMLLNSLDSTTKLPHCEICKLPRLLDPPLAPKVRGATSEPPANTSYCDRKPWARRPGHDIYGNPFLKSDVPGRPMTKKEREAKKKDDGTPEDKDADGTGPPSPTADQDGGANGGGGSVNTAKLEKGEKKASKIDEKLRKGEYVPWQTCPSCKRSLLITRFAKHLEQCMGLSGRAASRNAMAKMNGSTPGGSRGGTPNPGDGDEKTSGGSQGNGSSGGNGHTTSNGGAADDDDEQAVKSSGNMKKKLLKNKIKDKVKKEKEREREREKGEGKGSKGGGGGSGGGGGGGSKKPPPVPPTPTSAAKDASSGGKDLRSSPAPSSVGGDRTGEDKKRDREEMDDEGDGEEVHVKKRQKVRTASMVSAASTAAPEMDRGDSNDGSYAGDGSVGDD